MYDSQHLRDRHWISCAGDVTYRATPRVPWPRLVKSRVARTKRPRLLRTSGCASCTLHFRWRPAARRCAGRRRSAMRSEEHTSELQSQSNLVCRLLLEKKKKKNTQHKVDK